MLGWQACDALVDRRAARRPAGSPTLLDRNRALNWPRRLPVRPSRRRRHQHGGIHRQEQVTRLKAARSSRFRCVEFGYETALRLGLDSTVSAWSRYKARCSGPCHQPQGPRAQGSEIKHHPTTRDLLGAVVAVTAACRCSRAEENRSLSRYDHDRFTRRAKRPVKRCEHPPVERTLRLGGSPCQQQRIGRSRGGVRRCSRPSSGGTPWRWCSMSTARSLMSLVLAA